MNKNGSARDAVLIGVLIFFFGLGFFIIHNITGAVVDNIVEIPAIQAQPDALATFEGMNDSIDKLDYVIFGVFLALLFGMLISSWFIQGHPILVFIYIIVVIIGIVLGAVLANTWETASQASVFGDTVSSFPITNNLLLNLPLYNLIIGMLGLVIMFAKSRSVEQQF